MEGTGLVGPFPLQKTPSPILKSCVYAVGLMTDYFLILQVKLVEHQESPAGSDQGSICIIKHLASQSGQSVTMEG